MSSFSGFFGRRTPRDAKLAQSALDNLAAWAEREWRELGPGLHGTADLKAGLDDILTRGAEIGRQEFHLDHTNNPALARALLLGVVRSDVHSRTQLESALGVPFPSDD